MTQDRISPELTEILVERSTLSKGLRVADGTERLATEIFVPERAIAGNLEFTVKLFSLGILTPIDTIVKRER